MLHKEIFLVDVYKSKRFSYINKEIVFLMVSKVFNIKGGTMKKILMFLLLFTFTLGISQKPSVHAEETDKVIISAQESAILTDVDAVIDLNNYVYQHTDQSIHEMKDVSITSFSSDLVIDGTNLTVLKKGAHPFLLQHGASNIYIYVIAKETNDSEYILYEEDFKGVPNGKLPIGYTIVSGSAGIQDEKLYLSGKGSGAIVHLPGYLRGFTNYVIETDMTILEADNESRWASVMFRASLNNYYQMAIRQDASLPNGVEFAKRVNGNWNVTNTHAYKEKLSPAKMYSIKVDVLDMNVNEYINDELLISYESAIEFKKGFIGVQSAGSNAVFDNFRITLPVSYVREDVYEFKAIPQIYEPETKIVNPATILTPLESLEQLNSYKEGKRPATAVLSLDENLNVINKDGQKIETLYNVLKHLDGIMIPAIKTDDMPVAKEASLSLRNWGIVDAFIISKNKDVILESRKTNEMMRGVLDLTDIKSFDKTLWQDIRFDTNRSQSVSVIISDEAISKELVNYLQRRVVSVWTTSLEDDPINHHNAILSGVNGILTNNPLDIIDIYESYKTTTHVREVFIIAHRGLHRGYTNSFGPENSIEVALKAFENGARILETDIHLTFDNQVVVIHDDTTGRTAEISQIVKNMELDYLTQIKLKPVNEAQQANTYYIPSFKQYLEAFKGKDIVMFIEVKPTNKLLLEKARDMVRRLEMESQIAFIEFGAQNIRDMMEVMPEVSNGFLTGALISSDKDASLMNILTSVVPMKSTINPYYSGVTKELTRALTHRGLTIWPWTIDDESSLNQFYEMGVGGITTNESDYFKDSYLFLDYEKKHFHVKPNEKDFRIQGNLKTMDGTTYPFRSELVILKNTAEATFDDTGLFTGAKKNGEVVFYTKASTTTPDGKTVTLMSDLMFIEVKQQSANTYLYAFMGISIGLPLVLGTILVSIKILKGRKK